MTRYVKVKVFRDTLASEKEYLMMSELMPSLILKMSDMTEPRNVYIAEDDAKEGDVYVAPWGKRSKIVVVSHEVPESETTPETINYRPLTKKINNLKDLMI